MESRLSSYQSLNLGYFPHETHQATFISFKIQPSLFHLLHLPTMLISMISGVQFWTHSLFYCLHPETHSWIISWASLFLLIRSWAPGRQWFCNSFSFILGAKHCWKQINSCGIGTKLGFSVYHAPPQSYVLEEYTENCRIFHGNGNHPALSLKNLVSQLIWYKSITETYNCSIAGLSNGPLLETGKRTNKSLFAHTQVQMVPFKLSQEA